MQTATRTERRRRARSTARKTPQSENQFFARAWPAALIVAAATILVFLPAVGAQFVSWDDSAMFLANPYYRGLGGSQLHWMWTTAHMGHYVPLTWMTLGLDYVFWGMNPAGYHLVSVLIHAVNAALVYALARTLLPLAAPATFATMRRTNGAAMLGALLFAIHPLRVESVAWVTERRDVLSLCFYLAAVLCYLRAVLDRGPFRRWYGLALAAFLCGLLSKAVDVSLPAVLLLLNIFPLRRLGREAGWWTPNAKRVYRELVPFVALTIVAGAASILVLKPGHQLSLVQKSAVSAYSLTFYLWKTVLPTGLGPLYELPEHLDITRPVFLASYAVLAAMLVAVWVSWRRLPAASIALLCFLVVTLPMLGIVQNGPQIAADRYTYHASPALALLAASLPFVIRGHDGVKWSVTAVVVAMLAVLTLKQSEVWHDSFSLWTRALEVDPDSPTAHNDLGVELARMGRSDDAVAHYRMALAVRPRYADAHNNLGYELLLHDRDDDAMREFETALAEKPVYADAQINVGNVLFRRGQLAEAAAAYAAAARMDPLHAGAEYDWGVALAQEGRFGEAASHFSRALVLDPTMDDARAARDHAWADLREQQGRGDTAAKPPTR